MPGLERGTQSSRRKLPTNPTLSHFYRSTSFDSLICGKSSSNRQREIALSVSNSVINGASGIRKEPPHLLPMLKPLSHQLATSGDALATNNFGHIANASPDVARQRQYIASTSPALVSRRQRFVKLGDFFGMFKKIAKRRQRSPVNIASSSGCQRFANLFQQLANASLTDRQCFWTSKGESQ